MAKCPCNLSSVFPSEPISTLKNHPAGEASQTSGGSVISESSSVGFKPVPKKRTFLSRRASGQSESNNLGLDAQVGSAGIVPAPRRSIQRGSSGNSYQSLLKSRDEMPQKSAVPVFSRVSQPAPSSCSADKTSQRPTWDASQVSSNAIVERERRPPSITRDRSVDFIPCMTLTQIFNEKTPLKLPLEFQTSHIHQRRRSACERHPTEERRRRRSDPQRTCSGEYCPPEHQQHSGFRKRNQQQ